MAKKKQQGNGSGTIYPRKNKDGKIISYLGAYYGPDGKRRTVSAKTKTECREKLRAAQGDADKGMVFDAGSLTVTTYLKNWLSDIEGTFKSPHTYPGYERMVNNHLIPTLGRNLLKSLTRAHLKALYKEKHKGLSARTVQYIHTTLHKALDDAVEDGLIPRNVTKGIDLPKDEEKTVRVLSEDEARTMIRAARGDRLEALYILAVHTGIREGEILRLEWGDWQGDKLIVRGTKSKTSDRVVWLSQAAQDALRGHRSRQNEEKLAAPPRGRILGLSSPLATAGRWTVITSGGNSSDF